MEKLGLERNDPNISTLSAVGSAYEPAFPAKHGYLHHMSFNSYMYSGWISVPKAGMHVIISEIYFLF